LVGKVSEEVREIEEVEDCDRVEVSLRFKLARQK
jgi:hypothetical protein